MRQSDEGTLPTVQRSVGPVARTKDLVLQEPMGRGSNEPGIVWYGFCEVLGARVDVCSTAILLPVCLSLTGGLSASVGLAGGGLGATAGVMSIIMGKADVLLMKNED